MPKGKIKMKEKWSAIEQLLDEMIDAQHQRLLKCGQKLVPHLTDEDLWQPNDFPELETHPFFRYEEGVLSGMKSMQIALRAWQKRDDAAKLEE